MVAGITTLLGWFSGNRVVGKPAHVIENKEFSTKTTQKIHDLMLEFNIPNNPERTQVLRELVTLIKDSIHLVDAYAQPHMLTRGYSHIPFFGNVLLKDPDKDCRTLAAEALHYLGESMEHEDVIPFLKQANRTDLPEEVLIYVDSHNYKLDEYTKRWVKELPKPKGEFSHQ